MRVSYRASWTKSFKTEAADWIRFTFQPSISFIYLVGALVTLIAIVIVRNNPLLVLSIFCFAMLIFSSAMAVSFVTWWQFRRFNDKRSSK